MVGIQRSPTRATAAMYDLAGRTALVVGGYGAIGRDVCAVLAEAGARVVVCGRDEEKARDLAVTLQARGLAVDFDSFDATDARASLDAADRIAERSGTLDILVNCLGLQREEAFFAVTPAAFDAVYRTNLAAAMFLAQAAARHQRHAPAGGRQIHLLSLRSFLGLRGRGYSAFCAAKGGLATMVRQHAAELAEYGIRVNAVAPGAVRTVKNESDLSDPQRLTALVARVPLGRLATPADVAAAILFLSAPASDFVTGQILAVDGGVSATA
jgi:NAD(P)-dependent dehydrogenase (short-subunit alcohol dehydrogenase family)